MMTREEHLRWSKERAIKYIEGGVFMEAIESMVADLRQHPELKDHLSIELGITQLMAGMLHNPTDMRRFINSFN